MNIATALDEILTAVTMIRTVRLFVFEQCMFDRLQQVRFKRVGSCRSPVKFTTRPDLAHDLEPPINDNESK